jgi:hypothetical protein
MSGHSDVIDLETMKPSQERDAYVLRSRDGKFLFAGKDMRPTHMRLPKQLGGKQSNITDSFVATVCKCGEHPARVYILEADYMVMGCTTVDQWAWMKKPSCVAAFKAMMQIKTEADMQAAMPMIEKAAAAQQSK